MPRELNFFEKLLPSIALRWEVAKETLRHYKGAAVNRFNDRIPTNASAEQVDGPYRAILRARARDLERNSDAAEAVIKALLRNVIGTGINPQPKIRLKNSKLDTKLNEQLEKKWKLWCKKHNCDITGQQPFNELLEMVLRRLVVDGEIFRRIVYKDGKLKIQLLEADIIESPMSMMGLDGNFVIDGIKVDPYGKPLEYHVLKQTPDGFTSFETIPVPAKDMGHIFKKKRPTQYRGVTHFAGAINSINNADDYLEAKLVAQRIAASYAVVVTKNGPSGIGRETDADGKPIEKVSPGKFLYLRPGEDAKSLTPTIDGDNVGEYIKIQDRRTSAGMGLSYETVTRDVEKVNYSSIRHNHLEDRREWRGLQKFLIDHFCQPIWEEFVRWQVLSGEIMIRDFWSNQEDYFECFWTAPGWTWVDPYKDVKASEVELNLGLNSIQNICAEQGRDWRDVIDQMSEVIEYAEEKGVTLNFGGEKQNAAKEKQG